jgi:phage terminase large subunit
MFVRTTTINKILKLKKRVRAIQGGTSSGKTFGIIPVLINEALQTPNLEISIVSESVPHLKRGVIKDFKKILVDTHRWYRTQWHGSDFKYTFKNGSYIEFFSADNDSKLRGARRDILYINECNNVTFESFNELAVRTKSHIYLDWNPTHEFWFDEHLKNDDDIDFIIVTYEDNEACPQSAIDYILKAKEKAKDSPYWENWYKVYGLGELGQLQGAVFTNWQEGDFDESLPYCYGMDFGFSPDPTTLLMVAVSSKHRKIYLHEEFYNTNLSTDDIEKLCRDRIKNPTDLIIADSAEKREINELRRRDIQIIGAKKGQDSVKAGIKLIQGFDIVVTPTSTNLIYELRHYVWNCKKAGIPIDAHNHLIDPLRYAADFLIMRKGL